MSAPWIDHPAAQCKGKTPYSSYLEAHRVTKHLRGAGAYRCPHCHKYHVGHAPKAIKPSWPPRTPIHDETEDEK